MNRPGVHVAVLSAAACIAAFACGTRHESSFSGGQSTDGGTLGGDEVGVLGPGGDPAPCVGRQCDAVDCAARGAPPTTIRGTVYDPAGAMPLSNVYVYIPNTTPDPITLGHPTCTACQAPASGDPIIGALTDEHGNFVLARSAKDRWGVPSGAGIPLVVQIGKWRRQITIPKVAACEEAVIPNPTDPKAKLRLPAKSSEGDMPLIAFTSGCDPAECFLRHLGIDDSEFVPPGGKGHVHFYTGQSKASSVAGGNQPYETYQWWTDPENLRAYDLVFAACECSEVYRGAHAYPAMKAYLDGGGRLYTTHYHYNWFAPPAGPTDFQSVAEWQPEKGAKYPRYFIDSTFPKGKSFADWLQANGATETYGEVNLVDTRADVGHTTAASTRWLYAANEPAGADYSTAYLSFNTPVSVGVNASADAQCGRAVFSDVHLSGESDGTQFPSECASQDPAYAKNEKALEYLFFDLASCVQDDAKPPTFPPPK